MQGKMLHNYCETDSDMVAEQKRIEKQIDDFKKNVWGSGFLPDTTKKDSVDAEIEATEKKPMRGLLFGKKSAKPKSTESTASSAANKKEKSEPAASSSPRVSARRQRR